MLFDWDTLPSEAHSQKLREKFEDLITTENYGFGPDSWNISMLMQGPAGKKIRAFQVISGDRLDGYKRPERALKKEGVPLRFRLQVLTRQACCRSADGKEIVTADEQYIYDRDQKILVNFNDKPEPGDIVERKADVRDPRGSPHLSASHITDWQARGERMHYYEEYTVDKDGCISVPFSHAHPMLIINGFRVSGVRQFQRTDTPKPGEKPARRITNWHFKEVPLDFRDRKRRQPKKVAESEPSNPTGETGGGGGQE
jgi:hypothetical protein